MKTVTKLLITLVVLAVLITGSYLGFTQFDRLRTELAIDHFRVRPSETGVRTLIELVDDGSATPGQAERILPLLLTPKVTPAASYPVGSVPKVRVELSFEVTFKNLVGDVNEFVWVNGARQYGAGAKGMGTFRTGVHWLEMHPVPTEPGTYTMEIRYGYRLRPQRTHAWRWSGILPRRELVDVPESSRTQPKYECSITVPVEIRMVGKGSAGRTQATGCGRHTFPQPVSCHGPCGSRISREFTSFSTALRESGAGWSLPCSHSS